MRKDLNDATSIQSFHLVKKRDENKVSSLEIVYMI